MVEEGAARCGRLWAAWDARIAAGELPRAMLQSAKDEELVEILAGESTLDRKYARDIIATEILLGPTGLRHLRDQGCFRDGVPTFKDHAVAVDMGWETPAFVIQAYDQVPLEEIIG